MAEFITSVKRRSRKPAFFTPIVPGADALNIGLRAAYVLNENAGTVVNDATHNASTGTVVGAGGWNNNPPTLLGPTVNFDGNTYVQTKQGIPMTGPGFTVSCRLNINPLAVLGTNNWAWSFFVGGGLRAYANITSSRSLYFGLGGATTAGYAINTNTNYDVVVTSDLHSQSLYVNGVQTATKANVNPIGIGLGTLYIGSRSFVDASNNNFNGALDAFYVWDRALDPNEIALLHAAPFAPVPALDGLRKLYPGNAARTGAAATALTLAGPTTGGIGVVSAPFTVQTSPAFGTITGTCTITPSDGGAGGTFTPSTVTVTTTSPGATFTYTPVAGPTATISITNDKALTNPASIVMSVPAYVPPAGTISMTDTNLIFSPYTWRAAGGSPPRMVTNNIGAYLYFCITGTYNLAIAYDTGAQVAAGVPAGEYPIMGIVVDNAPMQQFQLSSANVQSIANFVSNGTHYIRLYHLKSSQSVDRWGNASLDPATQVRLTNILVDNAGVSAAWPLTYSKRLIVFGTSITEGIGISDATSGISNGLATGSWAALVADALQCEHGQIGFGGSSIQQPNANNIPALYGLTSAAYGTGTSHDSPLPTVQPWKNYDYLHSRLVAGKFSPAPDYVILEHGTNDLGRPIGTNLYDPANVNGATGLWPSLRAAMPATSWLLHQIPFSSSDKAAIQAAATAYAAVDPYFAVIDPGIDLSGGIGNGVSGLPYPNPAPSWLSFGNTHLTMFANARAAARLAARYQAAIGGGGGGGGGGSFVRGGYE